MSGWLLVFVLVCADAFLAFGAYHYGYHKGKYDEYRQNREKGNG